MKKFLAIVLVLAFILIPMSVSALIDLENENPKSNVYKAAATPVIDGKLDEQAYKKVDTVKGDFLFYDDDEYDAWLVANIPELYMSYDANNLYIFIRGNGAEYYYCDHDEDDTGNIWNQSCIQISLATADADGGDRLEIGLARNHTTGAQLPNIWAQGSDSNGKDDYEMIQGQNFFVLLDGGKLNYEVSIPWTTFLPAAPKAGDVFGLNFMYGISDDGNRQGFEYAAGCNKGKDASLFGKVTVLDELTYVAPVVVEVVEEEAPPEAAKDEVVVEAPKPAPAPKVGDTGMITLAIVLVIAAAGVVVLRRKAVR